MTTMYMGIDQYGQTYHGLTDLPEDLAGVFGRKTAEKMYIDKKNGSSVHIGYIISDLWITIYKVEPMENAA